MLLTCNMLRMICTTCIIFLLEPAALMLMLTLKHLFVPLFRSLSLPLPLSRSFSPSLSPSPSFSLCLLTSLVHYWWFRLLSVLWLLWGSHRHRSNWWVFWTTGKWKKERKNRCVSYNVSYCQWPVPSLSLSCVLSVCLNGMFMCTLIL